MRLIEHVVMITGCAGVLVSAGCTSSLETALSAQREEVVALRNEVDRLSQMVSGMENELKRTRVALAGLNFERHESMIAALVAEPLTSGEDSARLEAVRSTLAAAHDAALNPDVAEAVASARLRELLEKVAWLESRITHAEANIVYHRCVAVVADINAEATRLASVCEASHAERAACIASERTAMLRGAGAGSATGGAACIAGGVTGMFAPMCSMVGGAIGAAAGYLVADACGDEPPCPRTSADNLQSALIAKGLASVPVCVKPEPPPESWRS